MGKAKSPRSTPYRGHIAEKDDRDFRDFIDSVTATKEELTAITNMPDYSIPEVKEYLRESKRTSHSKVNVGKTLRTFQSRFERGWAEIAKDFEAAGMPDHQPRNPRNS